MKVTIDGSVCTVVRESDDSPVVSESTLLYHIEQALNTQGHDLIKKRMWKDGHLVSEMQQYLRSRKVKHGDCALMIWDSAYAVRNLAHDYRKEGIVCLSVERGKE